MQTSLSNVHFLTGSADEVNQAVRVQVKEPFDKQIVSFLNDVSHVLMKNKTSRLYSDVVTFAFWIRKGSINKLKERFFKDDGFYHIGKGVVFHIAPSNVPVNFAYSLVAGLLNGNANIVRVPSKDFEQISLIADAFNEVLNVYDNLKPYVILVRYDRDKDLNDFFSSLADMRVVWGGDATIAELRKSPLPPQSGEITFADRYSLSVIDSDSYLSIADKGKVALDFYNDTYFSDQNACTSPRIVIWWGNHIAEAKEIFWKEEYKLVKQKYNFQAIQAVNKLTSTYLSAVGVPDCKVEEHCDNLIIRIKVPELKAVLMDYRDNSGFFFEYDCKDIMEIRELCDDKHCQTIGYIGDKDIFMTIMMSGVKGVARIVPIGKTMDFDLIWDGYDLTSALTRAVTLI